MAWQTAPGMIIIVGGFSVVGALYAGVDGLRNWIYNKPRHILQDDFDFMLRKQYGPTSGKKL